MHGGDHIRIDQTIADIWLIGCDTDKKASMAKMANSGGNARQQSKIFESSRCDRSVVDNHCGVEHAIPIEKNRAAPRAGHHLVA
jgi:hypothetical protein